MTTTIHPLNNDLPNQPEKGSVEQSSPLGHPRSLAASDTTLCTTTKSASSSSSSCDQPPSTCSSHPSLVPSVPTKPQVVVPTFLEGLPGYKIRRLVGNGSFGVVYSAKCLRTNERVAIKSLDKLRIAKRSRSPAASPCSFLRNLIPPHPNIIRLIDVVETEAVLHMVMEYLPRGDLHKQLAGFGAYKEEDARPLFAQLVSAVGYLHEKGWVHRDIKLDNVLLTNDGKQIRLCDFGLTVRYSWTQPLKSFAGSPPFASPEVHFGWEFYGPESDIWSLGVVLYTMLTSSLPFDGKDFKSLRQAVWQANPRLPKTLSMESVQLLRACFARNPTQRTDVGLITDSHWLLGKKLASPSAAVQDSICPPTAQMTGLPPYEDTSQARGRQSIRIDTHPHHPPPSVRGRSVGPLSAISTNVSSPLSTFTRPRAKSVTSDTRQMAPSVLGAPTGIVGSQMGSWLGFAGFADKMAGVRLGHLHGSLMRLVDGVVGNNRDAHDGEDLIELPVSMQASGHSRSRSRARGVARSRSPASSASGSRSMDALHEQHEDEAGDVESGAASHSLSTSLEVLGDKVRREPSQDSLGREQSREWPVCREAGVPIPMASGVHWFFPFVVMLIGVLFTLVFGTK
ncbi:kinase-like domain-containing protein [Catenaria anguillulae PL171]|uniref:Kinase-like domain-containing protein n=1 Tax=Catenaria anguillulae PL171 TaxID=765915 RepID=A0A1Y2HJQ0_9FUNG|nr:kinase-like domain-containing protein [Catenaria anguillulae PL171]